MIALTQIRALDLSATGGPSPKHLSAASGLVCRNSFIYVVADDELHLGVFSRTDSAPGHLIRLFDGELPDGKPERKKAKPDFEALALLPAHGKYPHGALLALGSGSRKNRRMGALLELDAQGAVCGAPRAIDLSPLLAPLEEEFPALNIEGALVYGSELRLFQRGNKKHGKNAIIRFPFAAVLDAWNSAPAGAIRPLAIDPLDLGKIDDITLGVTDAAALPDGRMVFTAVAEDTEDAYDDGPCVGAAIGLAGDNGHVHWLEPLDRPYKIEGVDARVDGGVARLSLVTDADDRDIPAALFSATISL